MIQVKFTLPKEATISSAPRTKLALSAQGPCKAGLGLFLILTTLTHDLPAEVTPTLNHHPQASPPFSSPPHDPGHTAGCWAFQPSLRPFSRRFLPLCPELPGPPRPAGSPSQARGGHSPSLSDTGARAQRRTVLGAMAERPGKVEVREATAAAAGSAGARHDAPPRSALTPPGARRPLPVARGCAGSAQARAGRGVRAGRAPAGLAYCARASRPARPLQELEPSGQPRRGLQVPPPSRAAQPLSPPAVVAAAAARPSAAGPEAGDPARGQRAGRRRPGAEGR